MKTVEAIAVTGADSRNQLLKMWIEELCKHKIKWIWFWENSSLLWLMRELLWLMT